MPQVPYAVATAGCFVGRHSDTSGRPLLAPVWDAGAQAGSTVWRSLFATAAGMCLVAGVLHALGRVNDAYAVVLIAGLLGAVASLAGLVALRVETHDNLLDPFDPEVQP